MRQRENSQKVYCLSLQIAKIDLNYKLQLLVSEYQKQPPRSVKKMLLKIFAEFTGKHLYKSIVLNKEALAQVFSNEFCEIFKNTFFIEHHWWLFFDMFSFGLSSVIS